MTRSPRGLGQLRPGREIANCLPEELGVGGGERRVLQRVRRALPARGAEVAGGRGAGVCPDAGRLERLFELAMEPDAVHTVSRGLGVGAPEILVESEQVRSDLIAGFHRDAA